MTRSEHSSARGLASPSGRVSRPPSRRQLEVHAVSEEGDVFLLYLRVERDMTETEVEETPHSLSQKKKNKKEEDESLT